MKAGIVTFHFVNNYGGALQAYALRKTIEKNFCQDVGLVDYRHWFIRFTDAVRMLPITTNVRYYGPWFRSFRRMRKRRRKFAAFTARELNLSKRINFTPGLGKLKGQYQILIAGSDQIWNPTITMGLAKPYFLTFADPDCRKISYAASVGQMSDSKKRNLKGYLSKLDAVSIREEVDWLEKSAKFPIEHHIDPTFLLSEKEWRQVATIPRTREKYILTYFMQKNEAAYETVKKIKEATGYKVFDISRYGYKPDCVDKSFVDVGPEEFLGLFASATQVITNSFHGMAFSLIFSKPVDFIPIKRFSGRIEALSELFRLEKEPVNDGEYYHMKYDRETVQGIMAEERKKTYSYLEKEIQAAHDNNK